MQPIVYTVDIDASLEDIVRLMERHNVKRVPVVRENCLVGIISRADVVRALAHNLRTVPTSASDKLIRDSLLAELKSQRWAPMSLIEISVKDGCVELSGCVTDDRQRRGLTVAAENTPGAKGVKDDLIVVQPLTDVSGELPLEPFDVQSGQPKCVAF
jgi:CBS domain-containing protein